MNKPKMIIKSIAKAKLPQSILPGKTKAVPAENALKKKIGTSTNA